MSEREVRVGWVRPRLGGAIADVLTGNTYGLYCYVPVIVECIGASWASSRMPPTALRALLGGLVAIALAMEHGSLSWPSPFWRFRDPRLWVLPRLFSSRMAEGIGTLALRVPIGVLVLIAALAIGRNLAVGGPMPLDIALRDSRDRLPLALPRRS